LDDISGNAQKWDSRCLHGVILCGWVIVLCSLFFL
jgi:hypothetical protein